MKPGRVVWADGQPSNGLIPADVIQQAAPRFHGVASYLDHLSMWDDAPKVERLVGITFDPEWSDEEAFKSFIQSDAFRSVTNWGREQILSDRPRHKVYKH